MGVLAPCGHLSAAGPHPACPAAAAPQRAHADARTHTTHAAPTRRRAQIRIINTASLRDAFCNELVKLSPPELWRLDLHGSSNLRNFVLSPASSCTKLVQLDLSGCNSLGYVLVQSNTLHTLKLHNCEKLDKVGGGGRKGGAVGAGDVEELWGLGVPGWLDVPSSGVGRPVRCPPRMHN